MSGDAGLSIAIVPHVVDELLFPKVVKFAAPRCRPRLQLSKLVSVGSWHCTGGL